VLDMMSDSMDFCGQVRKKDTGVIYALKVIPFGQSHHYTHLTNISGFLARR
jgi:hypothetical protein